MLAVNGRTVLRYALAGESYNGSNESSCATLTHTASMFLLADVDFELDGVNTIVTGGYNNKNIVDDPSKATTKRRLFRVKNSLHKFPNYHGASRTIALSAIGSGGRQYDVDIDNVVLFPRASIIGLEFVGNITGHSFFWQHYRCYSITNKYWFFR